MDSREFMFAFGLGILIRFSLIAQLILVDNEKLGEDLAMAL